MELADLLKIMRNMIDGGNHSYDERLEITNFMFQFLANLFDVKIQIDEDVITHAYTSSLEYLRKIKESYYD